VSDYRSVPPDDPEERFVVVHRAVDSTDAEITAQILRDHGIGCRVIGTRNPSLVGVGGQITPMRIEVAESRAVDARELLAAIAPEDDDDEEPRAEDPRRPVLALGCVMLIFGGAHLYARRPWTTAVLAITQLSALFLRTKGWPGQQIGYGAFLSILLLDGVFGVRACRAHNRGERPTPLRQALAGLMLAMAAAVVGTLIARFVAA
jgi:hypothetical protein